MALIGTLIMLNSAIANKYDLVVDDVSQRAVSKQEIEQFASENNLLFIGESSALSDVNIKEAVEALMESKLDIFIEMIVIIEIHEV